MSRRPQGTIDAPEGQRGMAFGRFAP